MSSIAYVTDEEMLEYHRLCRNRTILFWRLSSKRKIADFLPGDLLFFFARPHRSRKKALIGYAHYDSTKRLSLNQMWAQYGESTGYSSKQKLVDAMKKAAKGDIPKSMRCLLLKDVVFFLAPIYPEEVGLNIQNKLESYTYLDRDDPKVTLRILKVAEDHGIDLWSQDSSRTPDEIFHGDEIRHKMAVIANELGEFSGSTNEKTRINKVLEEKLKERKWEMIRGSTTDCMKVLKDTITIGLPYIYQTNDFNVRTNELFGKITLYRLLGKKYHVDRRFQFELLSDKSVSEMKELVEELNHEEL